MQHFFQFFLGSDGIARMFKIETSEKTCNRAADVKLVLVTLKTASKGCLFPLFINENSPRSSCDLVSETLGSV